MQKKTLLIAAMTATAALAGFVVAGSAFGADWHEYQGKMTAGQAYLLPVPKGADALSFALVPTGEAPTAKLVVFDANDKRVGYFALDGEGSSDIVDPIAGAYAVYVYELRHATLSARLQIGKADELVVSKAETLRSDKAIVKGHEGALQKEITVNVKAEPVFATLLYQGSTENLNGLVESPKGPVMVVTGESGTSYAPGLNVGAASAREANLGNLEAGAFKVSVTADVFEGDLYLTTLSYKRPIAPLPIEERPHKAPKAPKPPVAPEPPTQIEVVGAALPAGIPVAFQVTQPALMLALPDAFCMAEDEDEHGHFGGGGGDGGKDHEKHACEHQEAHDCDDKCDPWGWGGGYHYARSLVVTVYTPSNDLLGVFALTSDEPVVLLEDLENGEYVAFAHGPADDAAEPVAFVVVPEDPSLPIEARNIALVESQLELDRSDVPVPYESTATFAIPTPPIMLWSYVTADTVAAAYELNIVSEAGEAYTQNRLAQAAFVNLGGWGYRGLDLEALVAGEYTVSLRALSYMGQTVVGWITFDRATLWGETPEVEEDETDDDESGSPTSTNGGVVGWTNQAVASAAAWTDGGASSAATWATTLLRGR